MKSSRIPILFLLLLIAAGCSGGGGTSARSGTSAKLVSITLSPSNPTIANGMLQQFFATGNFSDNTTMILTGSTTTWNSSASGVATISSSTGIAQSVGVGTTTITVFSGGLSDSTNLMVTPVALLSLDVIPPISSIAVGSTEQFAATATFTDNTKADLTASVIWDSSVPDVTIVSNATGSSGLATAQASGTALIMARSGNVTGSAYLTASGGTAAFANNVMPITVNGALCSGATSASYINKPCVSVTVCTPGTTTCNTINDILLDTGSYGLRIFKQSLTVSLTQVASGSGSLAECAQFGDGTALWGPVMLANVILGNESAVQVPIQVIDSTFAPVPSSCGFPDASPTAAGFTGILGVGVFKEDCGSGCANNSNNGLYYSCSGSNCAPTAVALAQQVQNPVASLPTDSSGVKDSNGVIVELPSIPTTGASSANGLLVLGIGTRSNNMPSGVTTYNADGLGQIRTNFNGTTANSIIDTGSNGLFFAFPSSALIPDCATTPPLSSWFCPPSVTALSATNLSASGPASGSVLFQIGNFIKLTGSASNLVFSDIGGPVPVPTLFDWGLPFYFGRNVYVGIDGQASSLGTGPYFAY